MKPARIIAVAMVVTVLNAVSAQAESKHAQPYAGQDLREIKTLSAQDVDDLLNGRGWGLAKAAELNGWPGPAHVLEMKEDISLTANQVVEVEKLFADMQAQAIPLGKRYVELERGLNTGFAAHTISPASLRAQLDEIAKVRTELRYVHLETHWASLKLLTPEQISKYNRLRGYISQGGDMDHSGAQKMHQ